MGLADGTFDPLSVVIFQSPEPPLGGAGLAWGLPESDYEHRDGMITKAEVRAVALGKLSLPMAGVLWDVGSDRGPSPPSAPPWHLGLTVYAVERDPAEVERMRRNLSGTTASIVHGDAPEILGALPDPDRAFLGGGGLEVLDAVVERLRPGGTVVATYAAMDRAVAAASRLGALVEASVSRGVRFGGSGSLRLAAENPVFVCWGSR